jgi:hypothetical protein
MSLTLSEFIGMTSSDFLAWDGTPMATSSIILSGSQDSRISANFVRTRNELLPR